MDHESANERHGKVFSELVWEGIYINESAKWQNYYVYYSCLKTQSSIFNL